MICNKCRRKYNEAGNVRDYMYRCPYCNHNQLNDDTENQEEEMLK